MKRFHIRKFAFPALPEKVENVVTLGQHSCLARVIWKMWLLLHKRLGSPAYCSGFLLHSQQHRFYRYLGFHLWNEKGHYGCEMFFWKGQEIVWVTSSGGWCSGCRIKAGCMQSKSFNPCNYLSSSNLLF